MECKNASVSLHQHMDRIKVRHIGPIISLVWSQPSRDWLVLQIQLIMVWENGQITLNCPKLIITSFSICQFQILVKFSTPKAFILRTRLQFNIHIFNLFKMTWCTWASSKRHFKRLQPSGEELLHNEGHSTSRITLLIFQWVNPLLPKWICVHWTREH